jgi:glycosyltransferase involved in cell wall biosynthesis
MDCTLFSGAIEHQAVPAYLNHLNIYVAPSRVESFGVAVLEASACGVPVVVSRIGGLPEVVENKVSGLMIESENVTQLTEALRQLVEDKHYRQTLGKNGRALAEKRYDWNNNVLDMLEIYRQMAER